MRIVRLLAIAAVLAPSHSVASAKEPIPQRLGTCAFTTVKEVTTRLNDGDPNMGSAIILANGVNGVSYDRVPGVERSRARDRVITCLVRLPHNCPKGDERGKVYTTTNLRTLESFTLPDAEHICGGA